MKYGRLISADRDIMLIYVFKMSSEKLSKDNE